MNGRSHQNNCDLVRYLDRSIEPLATIWDGAPQFVKSELRKLRFDRGVRSCLQKFYGTKL